MEEDDSNARAATHIDMPEEDSSAGAGLLNLNRRPIPRFPSNLRRIGRERDYIAPMTVAIGPYYHGVPELQPMEKLKRVAVDHFFEGVSAGERDTAYEKIKNIAGDARGCYADENSLKGITNDKFAEVMFIDGCFLVQLINSHKTPDDIDLFLQNIIDPHYVGMMRDMMLLENQIPWAVMELLMPIKSLKMEDIIKYVVYPHLHGIVSFAESGKYMVDIDKDYKPSHLLCLVRFYEAAGCKASVQGSPLVSDDSTSLYTSALELAEIGVTLEASQNKQFSAMDIVKDPLGAKLFLPPLNVDATIYCWIVNMAAFEMWAEEIQRDYPVNSYLTVLTLLMNRGEDVRELRVKGILRGVSSDRQTLEFFEDLAPNLYAGAAYWRLNACLKEYRRTRWVWIHIYRFIYNNSKTIATVLPIIGVLVGIFKAILSLKQPPSAH